MFEWIDSHIGMLKLNRPEAANALSLGMLNELHQTLNDLKDNRDIRCLIMTGEGEKAFCAGADLKERKRMNDEEVIQTVQLIGGVVKKIEALPYPVVAMIKGVAFGGGLELALGCDFRMMSTDAKVGLTETSLGIIPGAGGTQRLSRLIGAGKAKWMIFSAKRLNAQESYHYGITEFISEPEGLYEKTINIAKQISMNGPIAVRLAKQAIDQGIEVSLEEGLAMEHHYYKKTIGTKDRLEGLKAFQEKRSPVYKGE